MKFKGSELSRVLIFVFTLVFAFSGCVFAQSATGALQGTVADPTGAIIPGATVAAVNASGKSVIAKTDGQGTYEIKGLVPGTYTVNVAARGFARFVQAGVDIAAGQTRKLDAALDISIEKQQVTVEEQGVTVDTNPENNQNAIVLKGKDLEALSDDPDELQSELEALAGPSAGPNGGQIYIDGFTGGQLPPKSAIREIRINQNPFSAEFDKLGYGRIEIFTKPGTDQLHGTFFFNDNNSALDTLNPFTANEPSFNTEQFEGNLSGAITKKASFFFSFQRRDINGSTQAFNPADIQNEGTYESICAVALQQCQLSVSNPSVRTSISPRFDLQLTPNNTLSVRYQYTGISETNEGLGPLSTPSQAYNSNSTENTLQLSDTQVINPRIVNETRFQYMRTNGTQNVADFTPTIAVSGAFQTGGNNQGNSESIANHYELQNYTSVVAGTHLIKFGGRLRASDASLVSNSNANGTFTYSSPSDYYQAIAGLGNPNQFSQSVISQPRITDTLVDLGLYYQDDWKVQPNLTFSYGLRYETQNDIRDHHDFAPRLGVAWGLGKAKSTPKTVLRSGFGIFYDRVAQGLIMNADEFNDVNQQEYTVDQQVPFTPGSIPPASALAALNTSMPTGYLLSPALRAPYAIQTAVTLERQLTKNATLAETFLNSRGLHQIFLDNINAPNPFTGLPSGFSSGQFANGGCPLPQPTCGDVYEYTSEGIFKQTQLITNFNMRVGSKLFLFGFYTLNFAHGDTSFAAGGATTTSGGAPNPSAFPVEQFDPTVDYGATSFDIRNRLVVGGSFLLPYAIRISPFLFTNSGQPYNITTGSEFNGDSIINERPYFSGACNSPRNPNCFVAPPATTTVLNPSLLVPNYYGTGPNLFTMNLRLSKTIGFGPKKANSTDQNNQRGNRGGGGARGGFGGPGGPGGPGGGGGRGGFSPDTSDRRYSMTFTVSGRNIFNDADYATPAAVLSNTNEFGKYLSLAGGPFNTQAANRRIDLQVMFSF